MRLLLLILCALATQAVADEAPIYWQYPGPYGERLETAFSSAQSDREHIQLISESERRAHIKQAVRAPISAACLEDDSVCRSSALAILRAVGLGGRGVGAAERTEMG